jgi:ABC-type glycerol-3-phosphate transport system substrate-binding protein
LTAIPAVKGGNSKTFNKGVGTMKKSLALFLTSLLAVTTLASCGGEVIGSYDEDKTQIYVTVFNGGAGTAWVEKIRDEFNAKDEEYEVVLQYEKASAKTIIQEIELNNISADCYFTSSIDFQSGIYKNYFEDLSDVLQMEVDGAGNGTVEQKMKNAENWKKMASKNGEGCYIVPYLDAIMGLVYDHDLFVEKEYLNFATESDKDAVTAQGITFEEVTEYGTKYLVYKSATGKTNYAEGDKILSAGKDGKFGTYDDGQPQTEEEFDLMLETIVNGNDKAKTFIHSGIYDHYNNTQAHAIAAQYIGPKTFDKMLAYHTGGEEIEMYDGSYKAVTFENGYQVFQAKGIYEGLRFIDKYINSANVHPNCKLTGSYSHTDAQNDFILSYKDEKGYPTMLVEGLWWENEAKTMLAEVARENASRGYGQVNYRYMLLPAIEGQKGIDGKGNGTVFTVSDTGGIVVVKQEDAKKLAKIKEFLAMTLSDEVLKDFTKNTGIMRPYKYEMTDEDLSSMSKFARNAWEIYNDEENIELVRFGVTRYAQPVSFATDMHNTYIPITNMNQMSDSYLRVIKAVGGAENAMGTMLYDSAKWAAFISEAQRQGFYK